MALHLHLVTPDGTRREQGYTSETGYIALTLAQEAQRTESALLEWKRGAHVASCSSQYCGVVEARWPGPSGY